MASKFLSIGVSSPEAYAYDSNIINGYVAAINSNNDSSFSLETGVVPDKYTMSFENIGYYGMPGFKFVHFSMRKSPFTLIKMYGNQTKQQISGSLLSSGNRKRKYPSSAALNIGYTGLIPKLNPPTEYHESYILSELKSSGIITDNAGGFQLRPNPSKEVHMPNVLRMIHPKKPDNVYDLLTILKLHNSYQISESAKKALKKMKIVSGVEEESVENSSMDVTESEYDE